MTTTIKVLEVWSWRLIYIGLVVVALGVAVTRTGEALGWAIGVTGAVAAVTGLVMMIVRSRMPPHP